MHSELGDGPVSFSKSFREHSLEKLPLSIAFEVEDFVVYHVKFTEWRDEVLRRFRYGLRAYVLAESHETVRISKPKTWIDALLDRFCPTWLQEQIDWLVPTYETISVDPKRIFPRLKIDTPEYSSHVRIFQHTIDNREIRRR